MICRCQNIGRHTIDTITSGHIGHSLKSSITESSPSILLDDMLTARWEQRGTGTCQHAPAELVSRMRYERSRMRSKSDIRPNVLMEGEKGRKNPIHQYSEVTAGTSMTLSLLSQIQMTFLTSPDGCLCCYSIHIRPNHGQSKPPSVGAKVQIAK